MKTLNSLNRDVQVVDEESIDIARLHILIRQGKTAILTNLLISAITAVLLYPVVNQTFVTAWFTVAMLVNVSRLALWRRFKQVFDTRNTAVRRAYENVYAVALLVSGATWGALAWCFSIELPLAQQMAIPLIVCGMAAGALYSYPSSLRSFYAFVVPMILPVSISIIAAGLVAVGLTTLVFLVAISILLLNLHRQLLESLRLREQNQGLVRHLSDVNQAQTELLGQLQAKETFLRHTFEDAGVAMLLIDKQGNILDVNKAGCVLFGYDKRVMKGRRASALLHPDESGEFSPQFDKLLTSSNPQCSFTRRCVSRQGKTLWLSATMSAVRNDAAELDYIVVQAQDISEQHALSEILHHQTLHDALTGLPNRRALEQQIQRVLDEQSAQSHVLCYLDLDQFKLVNDTCGHLVGDDLLKKVSQLLQQGLRKQDFLARFSGDEFAIMMKDCSLADTQQRLEDLLDVIRRMSFEHDGVHFKLSVSIGVAVLSAETTLVEVLKQADSACYAAKEMGRDRLHVFSETDTQLAQRSGEMRWVGRIQQALDENRLILYSQNIVPTRPKKQGLPHRELLIRMLDDAGNILSPGEFLPAAERYNLAAAIDLWTVRHVLAELDAAREQGRDISGIYAINLSGQSLGDERFYAQIIQQIIDARLATFNAVLCFEITETAAITNMHAALSFINQLRQVGCQFALDDFGSGLSSFAYLKQLPVDYIKIDGMFVKDCVVNSVNLEIVNSINGIGQVLGLKTVAEFVEDEATLISMQHIGVDYVQGYKIGAPMPWYI